MKCQYNFLNFFISPANFLLFFENKPFLFKQYFLFSSIYVKRLTPYFHQFYFILKIFLSVAKGM